MHIRLPHRTCRREFAGKQTYCCYLPGLFTYMCWRAIFSDFHVQVLETYRSEFPQTVLGYSGHELGDHYVFVPSFKIMFANGFFNLCQNLQNAYEMFKPRCGNHPGGH